MSRKLAHMTMVQDVTFGKRINYILPAVGMGQILLVIQLIKM